MTLSLYVNAAFVGNIKRIRLRNRLKILHAVGVPLQDLDPVVAPLGKISQILLIETSCNPNNFSG